MSCKPTFSQLKLMQMSEIIHLKDRDGKGQFTYVIRVPDGWMYVNYSSSGATRPGTRVAVFVPEI